MHVPIRQLPNHPQIKMTLKGPEIFVSMQERMFVDDAIRRDEHIHRFSSRDALPAQLAEILGGTDRKISSNQIHAWSPKSKGRLSPRERSSTCKKWRTLDNKEGFRGSAAVKT
jgi:hypothetical protein